MCIYIIYTHTNLHTHTHTLACVGSMAASHSVYLGPVGALDVVHVGSRALDHAYAASFAVMPKYTGRLVQIETHAHDALVAHAYNFHDNEMHRQARLNTLKLFMNSNQGIFSAHVPTHGRTRKMWSRSPFLVMQKCCGMPVQHTKNKHKH